MLISVFPFSAFSSSSSRTKFRGTMITSPEELPIVHNALRCCLVQGQGPILSAAAAEIRRAGSAAGAGRAVEYMQRVHRKAKPTRLACKTGTRVSRRVLAQHITFTLGGSADFPADQPPRIVFQSIIICLYSIIIHIYSYIDIIIHMPGIHDYINI